MAPIKKNIKDLDVQQLLKKKEEITNYILTFPKDKRNDQGWATLTVINNLIEVKQSNDKFTESAIKQLMFEE